jgi:3-(3-hydroxy-phenyl)propionate hydroxylase
MAGRDDRVIIVGAGPVGLVAASFLAREGVPVTIVEASQDLPHDLRASTFHPPTLDMLERLGIVGDLIARGLVCPRWQFRDRREGVIATFDLGVLAADTRHPYRLQCEQWKLTESLRRVLAAEPQVEVVYGARAQSVAQDDSSVSLTILRPDGSEDTLRGRYLVAADGARSAVRKALDIPFPGLTIPEIFLTMSTPFDFAAALDDLTPIAYITDPEEWAVLLRTPTLWRVLLPTDPGATEEEITAPATIERRLQGLVPNPAGYEIVHATAYRVHERVAERYRDGRVLLAGDAAHLNNPLGGMGMNGGIHDAVTLAGRLAEVWRGGADDGLDRYGRERRRVAVEAVQAQTLRNRRMMAERSPEARRSYHDELRRTAENPEAHRAFLLRSSMIQSLRTSAEAA